jgi:hypothetical protein
MKSGDFPESSAFVPSSLSAFTLSGLEDDDEILRVNVRVQEFLTPKEGCRQWVYVELVGESKWRFFYIPMNTVLVVKEEPC